MRDISGACRLYDAGYKNIYMLEGDVVAWKRKLIPLYGKRYPEESR